MLLYTRSKLVEIGVFVGYELLCEGDVVPQYCFMKPAVVIVLDAVVYQGIFYDIAESA